MESTRDKELQGLALDVWRAVVLLQGDVLAEMFFKSKDSGIRNLATCLEDLLALDLENFSMWLDANSNILHNFFTKYRLSVIENDTKLNEKPLAERQRDRLRRRKDYEKKSTARILKVRDAISRYETASSAWYDNVVRVETNKVRRTQQDTADNQKYIAGQWDSLKSGLITGEGIYNKSSKQWWRLDPTECALRQRKRLRPSSPLVSNYTKGHSPSPEVSEVSKAKSQAQMTDQDYELVESVIGAEGQTEEEDVDRNRKVLRSLDAGDFVIEVKYLRITSYEMTDRADLQYKSYNRASRRRRALHPGQVQVLFHRPLFQSIRRGNV